MNKKTTIFLIIVLILVTFNQFKYPLYAQEEISTEEKLNQVLDSLSSLKHTLKTSRAQRPVSRKIRSITRDIIRAVNSIPPENCLKELKDAMNDFYALVSVLGRGISCGPVILPPFLPGEDEFVLVRETLTTDCLPPPEFDEDISLQIGGPFGGSFADVNPVYNECRDVFQIDNDSNDISDVCE